MTRRHNGSSGLRLQRGRKLTHSCVCAPAVKPFRVRRLLKLQEMNVGSSLLSSFYKLSDVGFFWVVQPRDSAIVALLSLYRLYCPHLLALVVHSRRQRYFRAIDAAWQQRIAEVQSLRRHQGAGDHAAAIAPGAADAAESEGNSFIDPVHVVAHEFALARHLCEIPVARGSLQAPGSRAGSSRNAISVEQLASLADLAANIDKLELPSQFSAVLSNK
jgi:hypothetical protein